MMTRCACISDAANMLLHYIITHYSMLSFIISDKSMTIDNIIILYMSHIILRESEVLCQTLLKHCLDREIILFTVIFL